MEINWSLALREKQRLQGPTIDNQEDIVPNEGNNRMGEKWQMRSFMICTPHQISTR
jgi:hypothetical protein